MTLSPKFIYFLNNHDQPCRPTPVNIFAKKRSASFFLWVMFRNTEPELTLIFLNNRDLTIPDIMNDVFYPKEDTLKIFIDIFQVTTQEPLILSKIVDPTILHTFSYQH